jgi:Glycosyltransferase 61
VDGIRPTEHRGSGSLGLSPARDLTAVALVPGAYEQSGELAEDTVCFWGSGRLLHVRGKEPPPRQPSGRPAERVCDEPVVWAGVTFSHYGHFAVESVGRLWPVLPGAELEGLPIVTPGLPWGKAIYEWLKAFGVRRVELPEEGAIRFKRMYVPEPAWRVDAWVAPEIRDIHLHVRRNLEITPSPRCGVLWLSRSRLKRTRRAYDECLFEWILAEHVTVFHPETKSLVEQIAAIEASDFVAGVVGSAFHSLLTAQAPPRCIYLCPGAETTHGSLYEPQGAYLVQDQLLKNNGSFLYVCAPTGVEDYCFPGGTRLTFPGGHRILIPETLRALREAALPDLFDDPRAFALAYPDRVQRGMNSGDSDLMNAVAAMLLEPLSADARMTAGLAFEAEGLSRCAIEQFMSVADLADDPVPALLGAARVLVREGSVDQASEVAERVLAIDPGSREVANLVFGGDSPPEKERVEAKTWIKKGHQR